MTPKKELETMLNQFKVSDLQTLLNFAGQNSKGRKNELQKKVVNLVRHNISMPLEVKIRTMYRQMLSETPAPKENDYYFRSDYNRYNGYYMNNPNNYASSATAGMSHNAYSAKSNYHQNHNDSNAYYDECLRKDSNPYSPRSPEYGNRFASLGISLPSSFDYVSLLPPGTNVPDTKNLKHLKFKRPSFFKYHETVVPLTPMTAQRKFSEMFDYTYSFSLSEQVLHLLTWSKKKEGEKESRFQLQLRICELDQATVNSGNEISDRLPLALSVKMNDKNCQLPSAIPSTNKQGMLLKRMDAPINISCSSARKSLMNTLCISWSIECNQLYGFTVHLVEKYTSDELIDRLKEKKRRSSEVTRKRIEDQLDEDDDIAATSLKVSLICPLGKVLMSLPVRASTCNHIQCFDGTLYIKMNEVKSVWQCPVCNSNCFYEDLFIDEYFVDMLKSNQFSSNVSEVQINNDGSWEPVVVKKRKGSENEVKKRKNSVGESSSNKRTKYSADQERSNEIKINLDCSPSNGIENKYYKIEDGISDVSSTSWSTDDKNECVNENAVQANVILVDLTSDSELEESQPLNLKTNEVNDQIEQVKVTPPVYDIDDSDEIS